jgi:hypothetical protein
LYVGFALLIATVSIQSKNDRFATVTIVVFNLKWQRWTAFAYYFIASFPGSPSPFLTFLKKFRAREKKLKGEKRRGGAWAMGTRLGYVFH